MDKRSMRLLVLVVSVVGIANSLIADGSRFEKVSKHVKKNRHAYAAGLGTAGLLNLAYLFKSGKLDKAKFRTLFNKENRAATTQLFLASVVPFLLAGGAEVYGHGYTEEGDRPTGANRPAGSTAGDAVRQSTGKLSTERLRAMDAVGVDAPRKEAVPIEKERGLESSYNLDVSDEQLARARQIKLNSFRNASVPAAPGVEESSAPVSASVASRLGTLAAPVSVSALLPAVSPIERAVKPEPNSAPVASAQSTKLPHESLPIASPAGQFASSSYSLPASLLPPSSKSPEPTPLLVPRQPTPSDSQSLIPVGVLPFPQGTTEPSAPPAEVRKEEAASGAEAARFSEEVAVLKDEFAKSGNVLLQKVSEVCDPAADALSVRQAIVNVISEKGASFTFKADQQRKLLDFLIPDMVLYEKYAVSDMEKYLAAVAAIGERILTSDNNIALLSADDYADLLRRWTRVPRGEALDKFTVRLQWRLLLQCLENAKNSNDNSRLEALFNDGILQVNQVLSGDWVPLNFALSRNNMKFMQFLLAHGADVKDAHFRKAFVLHIYGNRSEGLGYWYDLLQMLIQKKRDVLELWIEDMQKNPSGPAGPLSDVSIVLARYKKDLEEGYDMSAGLLSVSGPVDFDAALERLKQMVAPRTEGFLVSVLSRMGQGVMTSEVQESVIALIKDTRSKDMSFLTADDLQNFLEFLVPDETQCYNRGSSAKEFFDDQAYAVYKLIRSARFALPNFDCRLSRKGYESLVGRLSGLPNSSTLTELRTALQQAYYRNNFYLINKCPNLQNKFQENDGRLSLIPPAAVSRRSLQSSRSASVAHVPSSPDVVDSVAASSTSTLDGAGSSKNEAVPNLPDKLVPQGLSFVASDDDEDHTTRGHYEKALKKKVFTAWVDTHPLLVKEAENSRKAALHADKKQLGRSFGAWKNEGAARREQEAVSGGFPTRVDYVDLINKMSVFADTETGGGSSFLDSVACLVKQYSSDHLDLRLHLEDLINRFSSGEMSTISDYELTVLLDFVVPDQETYERYASKGGDDAKWRWLTSDIKAAYKILIKAVFGGRSDCRLTADKRIDLKRRVRFLGVSSNEIAALDWILDRASDGRQEVAPDYMQLYEPQPNMFSGTSGMSSSRLRSDSAEESEDDDEEEGAVDAPEFVDSGPGSSVEVVIAGPMGGSSSASGVSVGSSALVVSEAPAEGIKIEFGDGDLSKKLEAVLAVKKNFASALGSISPDGVQDFCKEHESSLRQILLRDSSQNLNSPTSGFAMCFVLGRHTYFLMRYAVNSAWHSHFIDSTGREVEDDSSIHGVGIITSHKSIVNLMGFLP